MVPLSGRKQWWSPFTLCMGKNTHLFHVSSAAGWDSQQVLLSLRLAVLHFRPGFQSSTQNASASQEMKAELFQLAGSSQTHQARTESRQVCEPLRSPSIAAMTDSFPDLPSEGLSGSLETRSQGLQQGVLTPCPASMGAPLAQDGQAGERET